MTANIRLAQAKDLPALCALYHAFHQFHVAGLPTRLASLGDLDDFDCGEIISQLAQIIEDTEAAVFVAELNQEIVGFAEVYFRQNAPNPAAVTYNYGYLQSLMVDERFRGQGIGRQLMRVAEGWARAKGAEEMRLETWEFPAGPLKFYENSGYHTLKRTLIKELE